MAAAFLRFAGTNRGIIFSPTGPRSVTFPTSDPVLTPVPLDARLAVTGHSIPDGIYKYPWAGVIIAAGLTPDIKSSTGPYANAGTRWDGRFSAPDEVRGELESGGPDSFDLFLGTEAHGGSYGSPARASVQAHIEYSDAYGYARLWHNLAAATGAQTFYSNFWRDDTAELFGSSWRAAQDIEAPLWDGIIDYVNANRDSGTPAMRLVPWLQVFMAIYDAIEATELTGVTMGDFFYDTVHPNDNGAWVQMATVMAVMYQRHPDEMPNSVPLEFSGTLSIDSDLAAQLRPIIWEACLATPRTGLPESAGGPDPKALMFGDHPLLFGAHQLIFEA